MSETSLAVDKENLEIKMERIFDAPRAKVWQAHTNPKLLEQWWGPRKYTTEVAKLDLRPGGEWKFINRSEGEEHVFYGEFREIREPEEIVWTFTYAPYPNVVSVETLRLEQLPEGKTKVSTLSKYPSIEALEGMVSGGMEEGARETWDRLAELLAKEEL